MTKSKHTNAAGSLQSLDYLISSELLVPLATSNNSKMPKMEALVRSLFAKALNGNAKALKQVLEWARKFCPTHEGPLPTSLLQDWMLASEPFTQEDYESLKNGGFLPPSAPESLEDADEELLNIAYAKQRTSLKSKSL